MADSERKKRTKDVHVRLTPEEYGYLKQASESSAFGTRKGGGNNFSEYCRYLLLTGSGYEDRPYIKEMKEIRYELRKIGTNINQIAYKLNSGFALNADDRAYLLGAIRDLDEKICVVRDIKNGKGGKPRDGSHKADAHEGVTGDTIPPPEKCD